MFLFTDSYGQHPALYKIRRGGKYLPVYYIYDSYLTPAAAWRELLGAKGNLSVRGTAEDGIFLGLLVEMQDRYDVKKAHFDGEWHAIGNPHKIDLSVLNLKGKKKSERNKRKANGSESKSVIG